MDRSGHHDFTETKTIGFTVSRNRMKIPRKRITFLSCFKFLQIQSALFGHITSCSSVERIYFFESDQSPGFFGKDANSFFIFYQHAG